MKNLASPMKRLCAFVIDALIFSNLELLFFSQITATSDLPVILDGILSFVLLVLFGGFVYSLINVGLTVKFGGSVGKLLTGLEVVNAEEKKISFWRAVLRNHVGYFASGLLVWMGFVWILKDKEHRGWHDLLADTYVVSKSNSGAFVGILAALALLFTNGYFVVTIITQINTNVPMYRQVFEEIKTDLSPTPTPDKPLRDMVEFDK